MSAQFEGPVYAADDIKFLQEALACACAALSFAPYPRLKERARETLARLILDAAATAAGSPQQLASRALAAMPPTAGVFRVAHDASRRCALWRARERGVCSEVSPAHQANAAAPGGRG